MTSYLSKENLYQCDECLLRYKDKEKAEECEQWCKEHKSCNLDIIKHAIKEEDSKIDVIKNI